MLWLLLRPACWPRIATEEVSQSTLLRLGASKRKKFARLAHKLNLATRNKIKPIIIGGDSRKLLLMYDVSIQILVLG